MGTYTSIIKLLFYFTQAKFRAKLMYCNLYEELYSFTKMYRYCHFTLHSVMNKNYCNYNFSNTLFLGLNSESFSIKSL